jgi:hypothetical protein
MDRNPTVAENEVFSTHLASTDLLKRKVPSRNGDMKKAPIIAQKSRPIDYQFAPKPPHFVALVTYSLH